MYDHVFLISLDTFRSDCMNLNPNKLWEGKYNINFKLKTDAIDSLAREGKFFTNCISSAPYTSASHASYFTAQWPMHNGLYEFFNRKLKSKTLFYYAQKKGYKTNFKTDFPIILGPYLGFNKNLDNYIIEDDDSILDCISPSGKSFNFIHFGGMHIPYGFHNLHYGKDEYIRTVKMHEEQIPASKGNLADKLVETYRNEADLSMLLRYKKIIQHYYTVGDYKKLFGLYLDGVNYFMEHRFTPFLEKLMKTYRDKKTLIVIFGDHGEEYDKDSYGHHNSLAEGVIRVPVIFWANDISGGIDHTRIRSIDIGATIMEVLGYDIDKLHVDGESLKTNIWDNQRLVPPEFCFSQAYTSETREFVEFQQKVLQNGKKTGNLRHFLYKEAAYMGNHKLHVQHCEYTGNGGIWGMVKIDPKYSLETFTATNHTETANDPATAGNLKRILDAYNARWKKQGREIEKPEFIRAQLIAMGYNV